MVQMNQSENIVLEKYVSYQMFSYKNYLTCADKKNNPKLYLLSILKIVIWSPD